MIHPHTRLAKIDDTIGLGVVATTFIPRGTICWVLDPMDRILTPRDVARLGPSYARMLDTYAYQDGAGNSILCWDHARFVNHSCRPALLSALPGFEIAVRDIHPGEELTDDYGTLNLEVPMGCSCGHDVCRGEVRPDDFDTQAETWDALIREAFGDVGRVEQPLAHLLRPRERRFVERALAGRVPLPTVRTMARVHEPAPGGVARAG